jgi:hypothetical protein
MKIYRSWLSVLLAAGAFAIAAILPASAALSPLHESIREIQTILQDPRLAAAFPDQSAVISVSTKSPDVYEFASSSCTVEVKVVDVARPPKIVGGRQFTLEFGKAECK